MKSPSAAKPLHFRERRWKFQWTMTAGNRWGARQKHKNEEGMIISSFHHFIGSMVFWFHNFFQRLAEFETVSMKIPVEGFFIAASHWDTGVAFMPQGVKLDKPQNPLITSLWYMVTQRQIWYGCSTNVKSPPIQSLGQVPHVQESHSRQLITGWNALSMLSSFHISFHIGFSSPFVFLSWTSPFLQLRLKCSLPRASLSSLSKSSCGLMLIYSFTFWLYSTFP